MVTRMLLKTVEASMRGEASAEPTINGCAGGAVESAEMPAAPGDGASGEAGDGAVALVRGLDEGIPEAVPGLSLWPGLAAVRDSFDGTTRKYHTTPATAQASSIAGSHFLILPPQSNLVAGRTELGGHR